MSGKRWTKVASTNELNTQNRYNVKHILMPCGCRFNYQTDYSQPYYAKWVVCGNRACSRTQGRLDKAKLEAEIMVAKEHLRALEAQLEDRWDPWRKRLPATRTQI